MPQFVSPVGHDYAVIFSHPEMPRPLVIDAGANSIIWSYNLISNVIPTYGGEVVQILGINVGPLTITGTARNSPYLRDIYFWMRDYMAIAGQRNRSEQTVTFRYPYRNWEFDVYILEADGFEYGLKKQHAQPWSVTCQVVSDAGEDQLKGTLDNLYAGNQKFFETMSSFQFDPTGALVNPLNDANVQASGGSTGIPYAKEFQNIGDNFQNLVAAWSAGDISNWSFDALADPSSQFNKSSDGYWSQLFGTTSIGGSNTGSTTIGSAAPTSSNPVAQEIATVFTAHGVPAQLGVAVALQESGLDPNNRQDSGDYAMGLFQTFPGGAGDGRAYSANLHDSFKKSGTNDVTTYGPKLGGYAASMQIKAAAEWFAADRPSGITAADANNFTKMAEWAQAAQRAGVDYRTSPRFRQNWAKAGQMLSTPETTAVVSNLSGSELSDAILNHRNWIGSDGSDAVNDIRDYQNRGVQVQTLRGILAIMNAGWAVHLSVIKAGHSNDGPNGHYGGKAADFNNYGPGGAASTSKGGSGTSSTDPRKFISFLQTNKTALGINGIGYGPGSGHPEAGADFGDHTTHVHVQWN